MSDVKLLDISGTKKENMKTKINELETNSKSKNIRYSVEASMTLRGVSSLELMGDFVRDSHSILVRWRNHSLS
jgi:hypothetical protein